MRLSLVLYYLAAASLPALVHAQPGNNCRSIGSPDGERVYVNPINPVDKYVWQFTYGGALNKDLVLEFDLKVDILVVGGGGQAGYSAGGGGGAGSVIFIPDVRLNAGKYLINVGRGGSPRVTPTNPYTGEPGGDTYIDYCPKVNGVTSCYNGDTYTATTYFRAKGGGGGGGNYILSDSSGGSGGGGGICRGCGDPNYGDVSTGNVVLGSTGITPGSETSTGNSKYVRGFRGGAGNKFSTSVSTTYDSIFQSDKGIGGGGGGGAGEIGGDAFTYGCSWYNSDNICTKCNLGGTGIDSMTIDGTVYSFASVFNYAYTSLVGIFKIAYGGGGGSIVYAYVTRNSRCGSSGIFYPDGPDPDGSHPGSGGAGTGINMNGGNGAHGFVLISMKSIYCDCYAGNFINNTDACTPCSAGSFNADVSYYSVCSACPNGKFSKRGASSCTLCPIGTFAASTGTQTCAKCPTGKFGGVNGTSVCQACSAGTFSAVTGLSACATCPAGSYSLTGYLQCVACGAGSYGGTAGAVDSSVCVTCGAGKFSGSAGMSACLDCVAGSYSLAGTSACTPCDAGTSGSVVGGTSSLVCVLCTAGKFSENAGSINCAGCPVGTYSVSTGMSVCTPCSAGTASSSTGRSNVCPACPIGMYAPLPSATACLLCPTATFSNSIGASICLACALASGTSRIGTSACQTIPFPVFAIVAENNYNTLRKVDLGTKAVSSISFTQTLTNVGAVGISPDGSFALVPNCAYNLVQRVIFSSPVVTVLLAGSTAASRIDAVGGSAGFRCPRAIAVHPDSSYALIADRDNNAIRKLDLTTLAVTTLAGSCTGTAICSSGSANGADPLSSTFNSPQGIAISADGASAFVADSNNCLIRKIILSPSVSVSTVAGNGACVNTALTGTGTSISLGTHPTCRLSPGGDSLVFTDRGAKKMRLMDLTTYGVSNAVSSSVSDLLDGDWLGTRNSFLVVDYAGYKLIQITYPGGVSTVWAGSGAQGAADGAGTSATFGNPITISVWRCTIPGYGVVTSDAVCERCPFGTYSQKGEVCLPCPAGTYSGTTTGLSACTLCPAGTLSLATNRILSSSCISCPANSASNPGRTGCVANAGYYDLDASLLSYYPFRPENIYVDASGSGYTLTDTNGALYKPSSELNTGPFPGAGVALLDNNNIVATAGTAKTFKIQAGSGFDLRSMIGTSIAPAAGFSFCLWYRIQDSPAGSVNSIAWMNGFSFTNTLSPNTYFRWIRSNAQINVILDVYKDNAGIGQNIKNSIISRAWIHLCVTFSGRNWQAYYNCDSVSCSSGSFAPSDDIPNIMYKDVYIGQYVRDPVWYGWFSDVRLYKKALTPAEVFAVRSYAGATAFSVNGDPALLAYYPFSSGNIYADASGNGYTLADVNTAGGYSPSYAGGSTAPFPGAGAAFFNNIGSGSGITVTTATGSPVQAFSVPGSSWSVSSFVGTSGAPGAGFSWCYWIRAVDGLTTGLSNPIGYPFVFWLGTCFCSVSSTSFYGLYDGRDSNTATGSGTNHFQGSAGKNGLGTSGLYTANWVHVCFVWQGRDFRAYLNCGSSTCPASSSVTLSADPYSGSYTNIYIGQGGYGKGWHGWLSEFRFYKKALTPAEVFAIKSYDGTSPTAVNSVNAGLLAYYPFHPNAFLTDASGVTGSLVPTGSPASIPGSMTDLQNVAYFAQTGGVGSTSANALRQFFTIPEITLGPALSICVWYNPDSTTGSYSRLVIMNTGGASGIIDIRREVSTSNLAIELFNGNTLLNTVSNSASGYGTVFTGLFQLGVWQHMCLTVASTTARVYYNGALSGSITLSAQKASTKYNSAYLVMNPWGTELYRGQLDEVRIYGRAISQAEVTSIYNFRGNTATPGIILSCSPVCAAGTYGHCKTDGTYVCCGLDQFFREGTDQACQTCPEWTFSSGSGSTCAQCTGSNSVCLCPSGTYRAVDVCAGCAAGKYFGGTSASSSAQCVVCEAGKHSPVAASFQCTPCPAGSSSAGAGASVCPSCTVGSYQPSPGASSCDPCPAGGYWLGVTACGLCPEGKFSASAGLANSGLCAQCGAGTYQAVSGSTGCEGCLPGSYSASLGASSPAVCIACPAGTLGAGTGVSSSAQCTQCVAGTYQNTAGSSVCETCFAGTYSALVGSSSNDNCAACGTGKYSSGYGMTSSSTCASCGAGFYQPLTGMDSDQSCKGCWTGYFTAVAGASVCTKCSTSLSCAAGTYPRCSLNGTGRVCCGFAQYFLEQRDTACQTCTAVSTGAEGDGTACTVCSAGATTQGAAQDFRGTLGRIVAFTDFASNASSLRFKRSTYASVLLVGGGGAGGSDIGGGGGGGAVVFMANAFFAGGVDYPIRVGAGGAPGALGQAGGSGGASSIGSMFVAAGGGGGGAWTSAPAWPGGSGGGGGACNSCPSPGALVGPNNTVNGTSGIAADPSLLASVYQQQVLGFAGGAGSAYPNSAYSYQNFRLHGGGGGGAGGAGVDEYPGYICDTRYNSWVCGSCGAGGPGVKGIVVENNLYTFSTFFGYVYDQYAYLDYIAGGGAGGSCCNDFASYSLWPPECQGGSGGGGTGGAYHINRNARFSTGSGGGGGGQQQTGGSGGSGLVLVLIPMASCVCDAGTFYDITECQGCPAGKYSTGIGMSSVSQCSGLCQAGAYSSGTGMSSSSACIQCEPGQYSLTTGVSACSACPLAGCQTLPLCAAGSYSSTVGGTTCTPCTISTYNQFYGAAQCWACATGKYNVVAGSTECLTCPAYSQCTFNAGASSCLPGSYNQQVSVCVACAAGTYSATSGQSACLPCTSGTYLDTQGKTACLACWSGGFGYGNTATACGACPAGKYGANTGVSGCTACTAGKFSTGNGVTSSANCSLCGAGQYTLTGGFSTCSLCGAGTYSTAIGANASDACKPCPSGFYSLAQGVTACTTPCTTGLGVCGAGLTARCWAVGTNFQCCGLNQFFREQLDTTCQICPVASFSLDGAGTVCLGCATSPVVKGNSVTSTTDVPNYRVLVFANYVSSNIMFEQDTSVDVLLIGGGGGGGRQSAGGGAAGTVVFMPRAVLTGGTFYLVQHAAGGGAARSYSSAIGWDGGTSQIGSLFQAVGGGGGGSWNQNLVTSGGGGAGACAPATCSSKFGGAVLATNIVNGNSGVGPGTTGWSRYVLANAGGYGSNIASGAATVNNGLHGGGGGGAGAAGGNEVAWTASCASGNQAACGRCGYGGDGAMGITLDGVFYNFSTVFGSAYTSRAVGGYVAGGGGGGGFGTYGLVKCNGGLGGGGAGYKSTLSTNPGENGVDSTGGGGGGSNDYSNVGGNGAAGMILIRAPGVCVCPAGTYSTVNGCLNCPGGTYATGTGLLSSVGCIACAAGKYVLDTGAISSASCSSCPAGTYGLVAGGSTCTACAAGTYSGLSAASASSVCTPCSAGLYSDIAGAPLANTCTACPPGGYSSTDGASACTNCSTGTYLNTSGASLSSQCIACTAGQYSGTTGASTCTACPPGSFSGAAGASVCVSCSAGKYSGSSGALLVSACTPCVAGTYLEATGASSSAACVACSAGSYSVTLGASLSGTCTLCAAGSFSASLGASQAGICSLCPAGKYSGTLGASVSSVCTSCSAGTYSATAGASHPGVCAACPAGTYSGTEGAGTSSACTPCSTGKYSGTTGATQSGMCVSCSAGTYSVTSGASSAATCTPCPTGTYSGTTGASVANACTPCSAGTYSVTAQATVSSVCLTCNAGSYTNTAGATTCTPCSAGTYSANAGASLASSCIPCAAGTYSNVAGVSLASTCTPCSRGSYSGLAGATISSVCSACTAGGYSSRMGASACTPCPNNSWSASGATTCSANLGYYNLDYNLRAYYPFNSDGFLTDVTEISGPLIASTSSPTSQASGPFGVNPYSAFLTASNSQFFYVPAMRLPDSMSICSWFWVSPSITRNWNKIWDFKDQYSGDDMFATVSGTTADLQVGVVQTPLRLPDTTTVPVWTNGASAGTWKHTCMTLSNVDGISWLNGSPRPFTMAGYKASQNLLTSLLGWSGSVSDASWFGALDDFRIYTKALSSLEVAALYAFQGDTYAPMIILQCPATCLSGSYSMGLVCDATGAQTCTPCSAGKYSGTAGGSANSACLSCNAGTYSYDGATACTPCSAGTYLPGTGGSSSEACVACGAGKYSASNGSITSAACVSCGAGTYSNSGASACAPCREGTYLTGMGGNSSDSCVACPAGTYSNTTGATASSVCIRCGAGTFSNVSGAVTNGTCSACSIGFYSGRTGASVCTSCPANSWSSAVGARTCTANLGYYNLDDSLKAYYPFNPDSFRTDVTGITGSLTASASSPTSQASGPFGASSYSAYLSKTGPQFFTLPSLTLPNDMSICSWFYISTGIDRAFNRVWDFGIGSASDNILCGIYPSSNNLIAIVKKVATDIGTSTIVNGALDTEAWKHICLTITGTTANLRYNSGSNGFTLSSARNFNSLLTTNYIGKSNWADGPWHGAMDDFRIYTKALTSTEVAALYAFRGDTYSPMIILACPTPCASGTYGGCTSNGTQACTACSAGTFSTGTGMLTVAACTQCGAGTYAGVLSSACASCSAGTYSVTTGASVSSVCTACSTGKYSVVAGASSSASCSACSAGTFSVTTGASSSSTCSACSAGTFSVTPGASSSASCSACSAGTFSVSTGASSSSVCSACSAGTFSVSTGASSSSVCSACSAGTFSVLTGASSSSVCSACPTGTYSGSMGASSSAVCTACSTGTYSVMPRATTSSVCIQCGAGTFSNVSGAITNGTCTSCPAGMFSAALGVSACTLCVPATFMATTGSSVCQGFTCAAGQYSSSFGLVVATCLTCNAGTYRSIPSTIMTAPMGWVSGNWGYLPNCRFLRIANSAPAYACGGGFYVWFWSWTWMGAWAESYVGGNALTNWGPGAGGSEYSLIGPLLNTVTGPMYCLTCQICPAGSFVSTVCNSYQDNVCTVCPAGQYSSAANMSACSSCSAGMYSNTVGASSSSACTACLAGTYAQSSLAATGCVTCPVNSNTGPTGPYPSRGSCVCYPGFVGNLEPQIGTCTICPANSYCAGLFQFTCPLNTYSLPQSSLQSHCRCNAGYRCRYGRDVQLTLKFNLTTVAFAAQESTLRAQIAAGAGVPVSSVFLQSSLAANRRLLEITAFIERDGPGAELA